MSQISSQPEPDWLALPIMKFSHNSSPIGTRNFVWNHTSARNDLDFVIRNVRLVDNHGNYTTRIFLKITAGAETLESQDLGDLITFARSLEVTSGQEQPIQVVIRTPFLAMRYPKTVTEVRRIQMKFYNDQQFTQAWTALKSLGLPITESSAPSGTPNVRLTPGLPVPVSTSPALSGYSAVSTTSSGTLIGNLPHQTSSKDLSRLDSVSAPPLNSPLFRAEFKIPVRPDSVPSAEQRGPPSSVTKSDRSISAGFVSPTSAISYPEVMTQMPSLYVSQLEREMQARQQVTTRSQADDRMLTESPFFASRNAAAQGPRSSAQGISTGSFQDSSTGSQALDERYMPLRAPSSGVDFTQTILEVDTSQNPHLLSTKERSNNDKPATKEYGSPHRRKSFPLASQIPSSVMEVHDQAFINTLPPKRVLPFPRSPERPRPSSTSNLLSMTQTMTQPALARRAASAVSFKTTPSKATPLRPKAVSNHRVAHRTPLPASKITAEEEQSEILHEETRSGNELTKNINGGRSMVGDDGPEDEQSPLAAKSAATLLRSVSSAGGLMTKATAPKKRAASVKQGSSTKKPKMMDQCTQTQTLSGRDHTTALTSTKLSSTLIAPPSDAAMSQPFVCPPESYLNMVDDCIAKLKSRAAPKEIYKSPEYTSTSEEDRQQLINDFICKSLEDEEFLQLVDDMGKSWRRHGLGM